MSVSVPGAAIQRHRFWWGITLLSLATAIALAYVLIPRWTSNLSMTGDFLVRSAIALLGIVGLAQFLSAWSTTRGAIATPGFGKHRMVVPMEGIVYLAIIVVLLTGAMLTKSNMLLLVFALMAGPFVINGWMTFGMLQATRVSRSAPRRAMSGELFSVELTLTNTRLLNSIWIMSARDTIDHAEEELNATVLFARVPPRTAQTGHYQLRLKRRGRYFLGPILTYSRFPLGLVERSRQFPIDDQILIYPRIGKLTTSWRRRWLTATELIAKPQPSAGVFRDEFHRLREFRTGDNPRDIHWRTSARRGELILREYQQNRDFNLAIVFDLWQAPPAGKESELIERGLSFAATILVDHGRACRDAILTFVASGTGSFRWQGQGTSASMEALFDGLALLSAGPALETKTLLDETVQRSAGSTQIILLTTRPTADLADRFETRSRVDVISLPEIDLERAVYFDEPVVVATPERMSGTIPESAPVASTPQ